MEEGADPGLGGALARVLGEPRRGADGSSTLKPVRSRAVCDEWEESNRSMGSRRSALVRKRTTP